MGAIVAADSGLAVASIMGCERFKASPSPEMLDGGPEDPLLELKGADFGDRTVPYIPDADDPPNPNVFAGGSEGCALDRRTPEWKGRHLPAARRGGPRRVAARDGA